MNSGSLQNIAAESRRKISAIDQYFDARHRWRIADSLLFILSDTVRKIIPDSLNAITNDSTHQKDAKINPLSIVSHTDSLEAKNSIPDTAQQKNEQVAAVFQSADSLHTRKSIVRHVVLPNMISSVDSHKVKNVVLDTIKGKSMRVAAKPAIPSADSLRTLKSIAAQELGDIFYSEIIEPDSAFYWYNQSLSLNYNYFRSPRILYVLAELSRTNAENNFPSPEEYYSQLNQDYPESVYAEEALRFLGKTSSLMKKDSAAEYYARSEKEIDAKQYEKAVVTLRSIIQLFPKSNLAAKSEYAIGWIMENFLGQPDSAIAAI